MWLSKVNVNCKYNVEREIVVVKKKKGNLYSQVPKRKKMVMNEMKMLNKKKILSPRLGVQRINMR